MNLKNMLGAASLNKEEEKTLIPMFTPWGENLDNRNVLSEYPRPQMRRKKYVMLNGVWDYRILTEGSGETVKAGTEFAPDGQILVPFSPESRLSGVQRQLQPGERLWYQRRVAPEKPKGSGGRCILHFETIDYEAEVYVNGRPLTSHRGGYLPFEADITEDIFAGAGEAAKAAESGAGEESVSGKESVIGKEGVSGDEYRKRMPSEGFLLQVCVRDDSDASHRQRERVV